MSVQFQFVDHTAAMDATLVRGGASFRTWARRAQNAGGDPPGTNQLKYLIDLAHLHGIAVIFDLV